MSDHKVEVVRISIEPHPDADVLEIARLGDYLSVVRKGAFTTGDLVAYIPEQSIVPDGIIAEMGLTGRLAGKAKNRVKPVKLRGVISQGLCYSARPGWVEGQVVTSDLGVTKYVPPIPVTLNGEVFAAGFDRCLQYDIENIKRYPHMIPTGEPVVITEKIHGTWCSIAVMSPEMEHEYGNLVVSSKGMSAQGLAFIPSAPGNANNLYLRAASQIDIQDKIRSGFDSGIVTEPMYIVGEIYGIQDLKYGKNAARDAPLGFRVFDVFFGKIGSPGSRYLNDDELEETLTLLDLERCPVLYKGPFTREVLADHTNGVETVSGESLHMREGVVVRPLVERRSVEIGRVQLKSVSDIYLLRKGGTEFN